MLLPPSRLTSLLHTLVPHATPILPHTSRLLPSPRMWHVCAIPPLPHQPLANYVHRLSSDGFSGCRRWKTCVVAADKMLVNVILIWIYGNMWIDIDWLYVARREQPSGNWTKTILLSKWRKCLSKAALKAVWLRWRSWSTRRRTCEDLCLWRHTFICRCSKRGWKWIMRCDYKL